MGSEEVRAWNGLYYPEHTFSSDIGTLYQEAIQSKFRVLRLKYWG